MRGRKSRRAQVSRRRAEGQFLRVTGLSGSPCGACWVGVLQSIKLGSALVVPLVGGGNFKKGRHVEMARQAD